MRINNCSRYQDGKSSMKTIIKSCAVLTTEFVDVDELICLKAECQENNGFVLEGAAIEDK